MIKKRENTKISNKRRSTLFFLKNTIFTKLAMAAEYGNFRLYSQDCLEEDRHSKI